MGFYSSPNNLGNYVFLFDWVWFFYVGKVLSLILVIIKSGEPSSQAEREALLDKEKNAGMETYIPVQKYGIYALIDCASSFFLVLEIFYMPFGLFIIVSSTLTLVLSDRVRI